MIMFNKKQYGVLAILFGVNLAFALAISTLGSTLGTRGPTGNTGPQGPQGSSGPVGETGVDGREVEFSVEENILVWRYVGDTTWIELDMEISGGNSNITTGGSGEFSDWIFGLDLTLSNPTYSSADVSNQTTYVAARVAQGYDEIATVEDLIAVNDDLYGNYVLSADLDLSAVSVVDSTYVIGNGQNRFYGTFDGAGYSLSGFNVNFGDSGDINQGGLFYELGDESSVLNLNLDEFSFVSNSSIYNVGALSAFVDDETTITLDNVHVSNFTVEGTSGASSIGGFIGETDDSVTVTITNSTAENIAIASDGYMEQLGGFIGQVDEDSTLVMDNVQSSVTIDTLTTAYSDLSNGIEEVGGLVGWVRQSSEIVITEATTVLEGVATYRVGGLIGSVAGNMQTVLKEIDTTVTLAHLPNITIQEVGGLFGIHGLNGLLIAQDILTQGLINVNESSGGLIGFIKEYTTMSFSQVVSDLDIIGHESLGGIIGYVENYNHRHFIQDIVVSSDIGSRYNANSINIIFREVGGIYGYIDDSNELGSPDNSQFWVNRAEITGQYGVVVNEDLLPDNLSIYTDFSKVGGVIGESDDYNIIRLTNLEVEVDIFFGFSNQVGYSSPSFNFEDIGGFIGYAGLNQLTLLNLTYTGTIQFDFVDSTNDQESGSISFSFYDIGGAIGNFSEGNLTAAGIIIDAEYDFTVDNVEADNHSFTFYISNMGGFIGSAEGIMILTNVEILSNFSYNLTPLRTENAGEVNVVYEIDDFGFMIGELDGGLAIGSNTDIDVVFTLDLLTESGAVIYSPVQTEFSDVGNRSPFLFLS
jgi:hypothetical protein